MANDGNFLEVCVDNLDVEDYRYEDIFDLSVENEYNAFTLAEVLITLGIIGVVAAMTLPSILTNVQEKVLESQVKKARNIVANGYKLMMAHYEIFKVENLPFMSNCDEMDDKDCVSKEHKEAFSITNDSASGLNADSMPAQYAIEGKSLPSSFDWSTVPYMFTVGDGMVMGVIPSDDFSSFDVVVDVNGAKNPNIAVKDLMKYRFSGEGGQLYDVSDELADINECSSQNKGECKTAQECSAVGGYWVTISGQSEYCM